MTRSRKILSLACLVLASAAAFATPPGTPSPVRSDDLEFLNERCQVGENQVKYYAIYRPLRLFTFGQVEMPQRARTGFMQFGNTPVEMKRIYRKAIDIPAFSIIATNPTLCTRARSSSNSYDMVPIRIITMPVGRFWETAGRVHLDDTAYRTKPTSDELTAVGGWVRINQFEPNLIDSGFNLFRWNQYFSRFPFENISNIAWPRVIDINGIRLAAPSDAQEDTRLNTIQILRSVIGTVPYFEPVQVAPTNDSQANMQRLYNYFVKRFHGNRYLEPALFGGGWVDSNGRRRGDVSEEEMRDLAEMNLFASRAHFMPEQVNSQQFGEKSFEIKSISEFLGHIRPPGWSRVGERRYSDSTLIFQGIPRYNEPPISQMFSIFEPRQPELNFYRTLSRGNWVALSRYMATFCETDSVSTMLPRIVRNTLNAGAATRSRIYSGPWDPRLRNSESSVPVELTYYHMKRTREHHAQIPATCYRRISRGAHERMLEITKGLRGAQTRDYTYQDIPFNGSDEDIAKLIRSANSPFARAFANETFRTEASRESWSPFFRGNSRNRYWCAMGVRTSYLNLSIFGPNFSRPGHAWLYAAQTSNRREAPTIFQSLVRQGGLDAVRVDKFFDVRTDAKVFSFNQWGTSLYVPAHFADGDLIQALPNANTQVYVGGPSGHIESKVRGLSQSDQQSDFYIADYESEDPRGLHTDMGSDDQQNLRQVVFNWDSIEGGEWGLLGGQSTIPRSRRERNLIGSFQVTDGEFKSLEDLFYDYINRR